MIEFNFAAFLQGLLIGGIIFLLYQFGIMDAFKNAGVTTLYVNLILLYTFTVILGFLEIKGLKGRVYWLPTWFLVSLLTCLMILSIEGWLFLANVIIIGSIALIIIRLTDRQFRARFEKCSVNIQKVNKLNIDDMESRKEFWKTIKHSFIFPSKLFLFGYPLFRIVNPNSVKQDDFVEHSRLLMNAIKHEIYDPKDQMEVRKFEITLEYAQRCGKYNHQSFTLSRLEKIINKHSGK